MTTAWSQPYRLMIILTVVVGMFTGCTSGFQDLDDKMHRKQFKSDYTALENALAAYDEGNFENARTQFKALYMRQCQSKNCPQGEAGGNLLPPDTGKYAMQTIPLPLACGMILPNLHPKMMRSGISTLLDPLIVRLKPENDPRVTKTDTPADRPDAETTASPDVQRDRQLRAEIAALKKKVKHAEQLQLQLNAVAAENRSLREKITALEAIDQNIQKKKTEISAPSE